MGKIWVHHELKLLLEHAGLMTLRWVFPLHYVDSYPDLNSDEHTVDGQNPAPVDG